MRVPVRLFAVAKQLAGCGRVEIDLPEGATIGLLRQRLLEQHPQLANLSRTMMFAIGTEYADDAAVIPAHSDVACIPPVSGG